MAEINPDPPLGSYFIIEFQTPFPTIYRGKPFEISWGFQGREPLEDDLITLYANDELIYSTAGTKNTSYMYTPTKTGPLELQIKMDTQRTDASEIVDTDTVTLTVRHTTIDDDIDYIAELLANTLQKQGVICSTADGLTTLIDKTCYIRRDIDEIPLDEAIEYINDNARKVGGTNGRVKYTLNTDKTYITRTVSEWSYTDECQFYEWPYEWLEDIYSSGMCFETIFTMQDARERPSIWIEGYLSNNEGFYHRLGITDDNSATHYSVLTTDEDALARHEITLIASNLCEVQPSDIISMRIYTLLDHIYYQIYNITTNNILFQHKQSFNDNDNIFVKFWRCGINIGYFGSLDGRGNISQINHISLSPLATIAIPNLFEPNHKKVTLAEDIGYLGSRLKSALRTTHILNQDHNGLTSLIKKIPQAELPDVYNLGNWTNNDRLSIDNVTNTITTYSVNQCLLKTEFTRAKHYTLEFDFYSSSYDRKGILLFGDSQFRHKFRIVTDIGNTFIEEFTYDNDNETITTMYTGSTNYLPQGWVHIKIIRQDTIAFIFIGDELFYTLTNLTDCTNVFGLWKWDFGRVQIQNIKLSNVNFVHTQTLDKTGYLLDTNNYTYLKGTSGGISQTGLSTIQLNATKYVLHSREFTHSKKYILTFEIKMSYGRDAGFIIGDDNDYMTWTQQEAMETLQHGAYDNDNAFSAFGSSSSSNRYTSFIPVVIIRNNDDWIININNGEFIHTCQYDFANKFGFRARTSGNVQIKNLKIYHDSFDYVVHSLSELDTALTNIKEGESLYIANGEYTLTKQYSLPSCTIIGDNAVIKEYGFKFNKNTHTPIEISGLKFICNTIKSDNPLIGIDTSADVHIHNCEWDNIRQQWNADNITIGVASPDYNIEIDHCIFKGPNYCDDYGHSKASICCWGNNSTVYNINIHHNIFNHSTSDDSDNLYNGRAICFIDATLDNCIAHHNVYIGKEDYNNGIDEEYHHFYTRPIP